MSAGRIVLLILGILAVIVAVGLLVAGAGVLWADRALTDDEGFFNTKAIDVDRSSYAVVTAPADISLGSAWAWDLGDVATIRVRGSNNNPEKGVFIGIAEESDLNVYLDDVDYDEVVHFEIDPDRLEYENHPGESAPAPPTAETFWTASTYGTGTQTLEWDLESGIFSMVLMNEDGSAAVDLEVVFGVKVPWLFGLGIGLVVGGFVALGVGLLLIYLAVGRRYTEARPPVEPAYPANLIVDYPEAGLSRLTTFFRLITAIPIWIVLGLLVGYTVGYQEGPWRYEASLVGGFVFLPTVLLLLFRQKYPRWWFDWNMALARFMARVTAYVLLLRDEYPSTDEEQAIHIAIPYPDAAKDLNRWLPLVKWFLAIPHYIVLFVLDVVAVVVTIVAWFAVLITGRYPRELFELVTGVLRWHLRVAAYAFFLTTDRYPPFRLGQ